MRSLKDCAKFFLYGYVEDNVYSKQIKSLEQVEIRVTWIMKIIYGSLFLTNYKNIKLNNCMCYHYGKYVRFGGSSEQRNYQAV